MSLITQTSQDDKLYKLFFVLRLFSKALSFFINLIVLSFILTVLIVIGVFYSECFLDVELSQKTLNFVLSIIKIWIWIPGLLIVLILATPFVFLSINEKTQDKLLKYAVRKLCK